MKVRIAINHRHARARVWLMLILLLCPAGALAQTFQISKGVVGAAGGAAISSGNSVRGTLGQALSGTSAGSEKEIFTGFWAFRYQLVAIGDRGVLLPERFELGQNYPNPFNPGTTIRFALPEAAAVRIEIYDMLGRRVAILAGGEGAASPVQPGWHEVRWDGRNQFGYPVASGMYVYRMIAGDFLQTRKMLLVR